MPRRRTWISRTAGPPAPRSSCRLELWRPVSPVEQDLQNFADDFVRVQHRGVARVGDRDATVGEVIDASLVIIDAARLAVHLATGQLEWRQTGRFGVDAAQGIEAARADQLSAEQRIHESHQVDWRRYHSCRAEMQVGIGFRPAYPAGGLAHV